MPKGGRRIADTGRGAHQRLSGSVEEAAQAAHPLSQASAATDALSSTTGGGHFLLPFGRLEPCHVGIGDMLRHEFLQCHLDSDPSPNAFFLQAGLKLGILRMI